MDRSRWPERSGLLREIVALKRIDAIVWSGSHLRANRRRIVVDAAPATKQTTWRLKQNRQQKPAYGEPDAGQSNNHKPCQYIRDEGEIAV
jgi:hypothetical protein